MVHLHITRSSTNIHINHVSSLDKRNFVYNCTVIWNNCPVHIRSLYTKICISASVLIVFEFC